MTTAQITIPYKPREAFRPYHDNDKRFSVTVRIAALARRSRASTAS